ncbi:hypothetical protein [Steroidobacter cummioxidans]|uniref:hypothetical protein n=1 Tax=Steroidobacter cummioxidans TaxID=1803913 RepID=UPI0012905426|nr:hypothetical protein [Steroidobacter cummioxidans]
MGLSETIMAAMIGALATVTTALFQLFSSFKQQRSSKVDVRPKKGSTLRSVLAVLALMVASAAGGFLYSELIKQRAEEDMRAMRGELKELRSLIAAEQEAERADVAAAAKSAAMDHHAVTLPAAMESVADSVESVVYVPACRAGNVTTGCNEQEAQRIALCGTIPAYARVDRIQLFAQPDAMQHPWDKHQVSFDQDLGGARFTGNSFEYAQGEDLKAVCVNFVQWSSEHPHIARIVVEFGFGNVPAPAASAPVPAVIAAESLHAGPTPAAFAGTGATQ